MREYGGTRGFVEAACDRQDQRHLKNNAAGKPRVPKLIRSENVLQRELDNARIGGGALNYVKRAPQSILRGDGIIELGMVEQVEELGAEQDLMLLRDVGYLLQRDVVAGDQRSRAAARRLRLYR